MPREWEGIRSHRQRSCCLVAVMLALSVTSLAGRAPAAAAQDVSLRFAENAPLALGPKPATIVVVNESDTAWDAELQLALFGQDGSASSAFTIKLPKQAVPSGGSKAFVIERDTMAEVADATGALVLIGTSEGRTVRATRAVTASAKAHAEPAVKKLTIVSKKRHPFARGSRVAGAYLPLKEGATCPEGTEPPESASITVSDGSTTKPLKYTCEAGTNGGIFFDASEIKKPATYSGTMKVGDTDIELTVRQTSTVSWAIATLLVGILVALLRYTWSANIHPVRRARLRLSKMSGEATTAQGRFERMAAGAAYRRYQFMEGVQRRIVELQTELDEARPAFLKRWYMAFAPSEKDLQDQVLEKVGRKMASLDATIRAWPGLADDLAELRARLDSITGKGLDHLARSLVDRGRVLLHPTDAGELSVEADAAATLVAEVPATSDALALLPAAHELDQRLKEVEPDGGEPADEAVWSRARQLHRQAMAELREAKDANDVIRAGVDELLQTARRLALQLEPRQEGEGQGSADPTVVKGSGSWVNAVALLKRISRPIQSVLRGGPAVGLVWFLLAVGVAVWSGLSSLYIDRPWGTARDYLAMLVWAFGVTTVVPTVLTSLEELAAGPAPLKASPKPSAQEEDVTAGRG